MREQEVDLKLISGRRARDRDRGRLRRSGSRRTPGVDRGRRSCPTTRAALAEVAERNTIFCRIKPEQKKALVGALSDSRALHGDDRRRRQRRAGAEAGADGGGDGLGQPDHQGRSPTSCCCKDEFSRLPRAVAEGRRIARNIHRLGRLYLTKTVYAAALILLVAVPGFAFPFLPRHLTLAALPDDRDPVLRARPGALRRAALPRAAAARAGGLRRAGGAGDRGRARSSPSSSSTRSSAAPSRRAAPRRRRR